MKLMPKVSDKTLQQFVSESLEIENIGPKEGNKKGHPVFKQSLYVARRVATWNTRKVPLHSLNTHRVMFKGIYPHAGLYRDCEVEVASKLMPHWQFVPQLMEQWWNLVLEFKEAKTEDFKGKEADVAFMLHSWYLCIHPHRDGNGRNARMQLNMFRLWHGLPWLIIFAHKKASYYREIDRFEEKIFRPGREHMYPESPV